MVTRTVPKSWTGPGYGPVLEMDWSRLEDWSIYVWNMDGPKKRQNGPESHVQDENTVEITHMLTNENLL